MGGQFRLSHAGQHWVPRLVDGVPRIPVTLRVGGNLKIQMPRHPPVHVFREAQQLTPDHARGCSWMFLWGELPYLQGVCNHEATTTGGVQKIQPKPAHQNNSNHILVPCGQFNQPQ